MFAKLKLAIQILARMQFSRNDCWYDVPTLSCSGKSLRSVWQRGAQLVNFSGTTTPWIAVWLEKQLDCLLLAIDKNNTNKIYICLHYPVNVIYIHLNPALIYEDGYSGTNYRSSLLYKLDLVLQSLGSRPTTGWDYHKKEF